MLSKDFNVILAHNCKIDTYCPSVDDICDVAHISIQRRVSFFRDIWASIQLVQLILRFKPVIAITVAPKAGLIGMLITSLLRVKIRLNIFQGEVWENRCGIWRFILMTCDSFIIKSSTHLLCVSPSEKKLLESTFVIKPGKLILLGHGTICGVKPNYFDVDQSLVDKAHSFYNFPRNSKVCIYFGRICVEKGIKDLINAFCLLDHSSSDFRLIFVGPQENFSVLEEIKEQPTIIRDRIFIHGFTNEPEVLLVNADFVCLPSYREGYPISILEAAAVGIPAIGTRISGIWDAIVENETGLLCEPRNVCDLAQCLSLMFDDNRLRLKLGKNAKSRVENKFKQSKVVSLYTQYIKYIYNDTQIIRNI